MTTLNPYLSFSNNCEEAFNFYRTAFGGEFSSLVRFKDLPMEGFLAPPEEDNLIMHIALPISGDFVLMGSDTPKAMGEPNAGNNLSLSVSCDSKEEVDRLFGKLSEGGKVTMPIGDVPWGAYFGMFSDKFGFTWMVSYEYSK